MNGLIEKTDVTATVAARPIVFPGGVASLLTDETRGRVIDQDRIARAVREILLAIGDDPEREGVRDTPARVARSYAEMLGGLLEDPAAHLGRVFDHAGDEVVMLRDIPFASMCEHHLLPFFGKAHLAYLPGNGKVVGLSKLARTVEGFARRPQLQERLAAEIADALESRLEAPGVTVILEAEHLCLRLRGARAAGASMKTVTHRGVFARDAERRREVVSLLSQ